MRAVETADTDVGDALTTVFKGVGRQCDASTQVAKILLVQFHDGGL
jgi:hypothetical protein